MISGNTYKNDALGFAYEFPTGWVINDQTTHDKVMEAGHQFAWGDNPSSAREHAAFQQCARVLLMATKYPAGTKAEGYNPLIVVIAVDSACSPDAHFPGSIDDRDSIKEAAQQLVRSFAGSPFVSLHLHRCHPVERLFGGLGCRECESVRATGVEEHEDCICFELSPYLNEKVSTLFHSLSTYHGRPAFIE